MPAFLIISGYLTNVQKDIKSFMRKLLWIFIPYLCLETGYVLMSHILPVRENVPEISSSILLHIYKAIGSLLVSPHAYYL